MKIDEIQSIESLNNLCFKINRRFITPIREGRKSAAKKNILNKYNSIESKVISKIVLNTFLMVLLGSGFLEISELYTQHNQTTIIDTFNLFFEFYDKEETSDARLSVFLMLASFITFVLRSNKYQEKYVKKMENKIKLLEKQQVTDLEKQTLSLTIQNQKDLLFFFNFIKTDNIFKTWLKEEICNISDDLERQTIHENLENSFNNNNFFLFIDTMNRLIHNKETEKSSSHFRIPKPLCILLKLNLDYNKEIEKQNTSNVFLS